MDIRRNWLHRCWFHYVLCRLHGHLPHGGHLSRAPLRTSPTNEREQHIVEDYNHHNCRVYRVEFVLVRDAAIRLVVLFARGGQDLVLGRMERTFVLGH